MDQIKEEIRQVRAENVNLRRMLLGRSSPASAVPVSIGTSLDGSSPAAFSGEGDAALLGKGVPGSAASAGFAWDFGGQWRVMANGSNFGFHSPTIGDQDDDGFLNERLRTWLSVSPEENVEGYIQVEIGHVTFGEDFEFPKAYAREDTVGIELRRGYLTYRNEDIGDFRIGIQDWHDMFYATGSSISKENAVDDYRAFGSVLANGIWDFNVGGLTWYKQFPSAGDLEIRLGGYVPFRDAPGLRVADTQLWAADLDLPVCEGAGIGWSFYWVHDSERYSYPTLADDRQADHMWTGLRGHARVGDVPLNGFLIFNKGWRDEEPPDEDFEHAGWAAKVEAGTIELSPGKLSFQFLFATGEDDEDDDKSDEFRTIAQSARDNLGAQGYWSYLFLTSPHGPSDVKDLGVGLQNRGLGLYTVHMRRRGQTRRTPTTSTRSSCVRNSNSNGPFLANRSPFDGGCFMSRLNLLGPLLALLVWPTTVTAQGNTNDAKRIEALENRLKALEEQNRQLMDDLRAIRAAQTTPPAPGATPAKKDVGISATFKDGLKVTSEDGVFNMHIGGRLITSSRTFFGETRNNDTFVVDAARLEASGTYYKDYEFKVQGDFGKGTVVLKDGYVGWKRWPELSLRIGQFKEPFSVEELTSARFIDFIQRSPMNRLVPGRDIGFMFHGKTWEERLEYQLGVFNGNGSHRSDDSNDDKDIAARLALKPFAPSEDKMLKGISVGGAITYGSEDQTFGNLSMLDSGTTFLTMSSSSIRARQDRRRLNTEAVWLWGPFKLQGEVTWMDVDLHRFAAGVPNNKVETTAAFTSWYTEALWVVTGEDAVMERRKPAKNFLADGGCGQIELAVRFSQFWVDEDLFDEGFVNAARSTDGFDNWTGGVNWWLNPYVRVSLNYFYNNFWDDFQVGGKMESDEHGVLTRFQIDF